MNTFSKKDLEFFAIKTLDDYDSKNPSLIFKDKIDITNEEALIIQFDLDGDPRANLELNSYEDRMARLMAVMIGIFDPDVIILGGGMSNIDRLYKNIPSLIPKYTFSNKVITKVLKNIHGDSSGVRGAAWLWNNA